MAGPFQDPPFSIFKVSPISIVPKSQPGKFRLLHNLSSPYDIRAVNFNIPRSFASVVYESLEDAIEIINLYSKPYLSKFDIKDAFRLIPLHPDDYYLTGLKWQDNFYINTCLPMGCSSSCFIFEKFSSALKHIFQNHLNIPHVVKLLDDFLIISPSLYEANQSLNKIFQLLKQIGVPLAHEKTVYPTHSLTFLGILLDTSSMTASIPPEKSLPYLDLINLTIISRKITLSNLRSMLGKLQHVTAVVRAGRPFLRRLYDLTACCSKSFHTIHLADDAIHDLIIWREFLTSFNFKSIRSVPWVDNSTISFHSDASNWGFGVTFGSSWLQAPWPASWSLFHINLKELFPIYLALEIFAPKLKDSSVIFYTDSKCVADSLSKLTSKSSLHMSLIRPITLTLLKFNIFIDFRHIIGKKNIIADLLSRQVVSTPSGSLQPTLRRHPIYGPLLSKLKPTPVCIPTHLLPDNVTIPLPTPSALLSKI